MISWFLQKLGNSLAAAEIDRLTRDVKYSGRMIDNMQTKLSDCEAENKRLREVLVANMKGKDWFSNEQH